MSKETAEWLNTHTLIGDTDRRGNAWHYRADLQDGEGNHYPGAIPLNDIQRRLFDWTPVSVPVYVKVPCSEDEALGYAKDGGAITSEVQLSDDGTSSGRQFFRFIERPGRQNITADDDVESDFGMFRPGYQIHGYWEWLGQNVANLVDGEVHASSAGLLKNRAQAWVELSLSETQSVADFPFRAHLLAYTSLDGTLATTYKRAVQAVVCDNTLSAAVSEQGGQIVKVKHSKYSKLKMATARDALGIIVATADDFSAQVNELLSVKVTPKHWSRVLDITSPVVDEKGQPLAPMSVTKAEARRERLTTMYRSDLRCAPWTGTAFGVLQTFNTYFHHERKVNTGTNRAERNMSDAIRGVTADHDAEILSVINLVTAT